MQRGVSRFIFRAALAGVLLLVLGAGAVFGYREFRGRPSAADGAAGGAGGGASFTVAAAGDILIHPEVTAQAVKDAKQDGKAAGGAPDYDRVLAGVAPVIRSADLAICHFETAVAPAKGPFLGYRRFSVPPQIAATLKRVGYDTCSTASNHTLDHGAAGVRRTLDALDAAGLRHTGSARSAAEAARPTILTVKGVKVAQLSYAYGFNDTRVPKKTPWLANTIDVRRIAADEKAARAAGAEVVIASLHWGREQHNEASKGQLELGRRIAAETGVDLIIGHHAHVAQPFEKVDGTWIAYGLGNQIARHAQPLGTTEEGVIGWFRFTKRNGHWTVSQARYEPTLVELKPAIRVVDVARALARPDLPAATRSRYRLAYERTGGIVLNRGAGRDGLRPLTAMPSG